ncbi:MAG: glucosaminidase domain-containing protein [Bacteroidota bacterium]
MKKQLWLIVTLLLCTFIVSAQESYQQRYIKKFKKIAIEEMRRTGIPASIKLGQGILESNAGKSTLARKANNHFGIKCHRGWEGGTYYKEDDDYDENGQLIKSCFRAYRNAEASYVAHSEFLRDPRKRFRYGFLFDLDPKDYKAWARGLKKAGYATSPTYAEKLIRVIESYELYQYDSEAVEEGGDRPNRRETRREQMAGVLKNNSVKYVKASGTESAADIASRTGVKLKSIRKYNERLGDAYEKLPEGTYVYLQRKRGGYRGKKKWHVVQENENLYAIAQQYGVMLNKLMRRNRLENGQEPAVGEPLKIRGWFRVPRGQRPRLRSEVFDDTPRIENDSEELLMEEEENTEENFGGEIEEELELDPDTELDPDFPTEEPSDQPVFEEPGTPNNPDPGTVQDDPVIEEPVIIETPNQFIYHTVEKGDTLFGISRRYNTTVDTIKRLNGLDSNLISVGQWLRVK